MEARRLKCNCCKEVIHVFEFPAAWADPETFWCVPCMDARYWGIYPQSKTAVESRRRGNGKLVIAKIDPATMPFPEGF